MDGKTHQYVMSLMAPGTTVRSASAETRQVLVRTDLVVYRKPMTGIALSSFTNNDKPPHRILQLCAGHSSNAL